SGILPGVIFARRVVLLEDLLARRSSLVVALSGGVDSAALLGVAARVVPGRVVGATARSAAVPEEEIASAARAARRAGVPHRVVDTDELADAGYRANAGERCYFCRREMYGRLHALARAEGIGALADGLHADDDAGDRPGIRAAGERGVLHPLRDAGLGKAAVRRLARALGLPHHDRPAEPCLASRLPVGVEVTVARLRRVGRAERALKSLGFRVVRVRCSGRHGRIEVGGEELERARREEGRLVAAVLEAGFVSAALDPAGYRAPGAGRTD
ncbi:MAG: ATP-dependent sacrificial sulfur transferase LarE, partial [Planctomycetota bacterium]